MHRGKLSCCLNPVLERQDNGFVAYHGPNRIGDAGDLPRLDTHQYRVNGSHRFRIIGSRHRRHDEVTLGTIDAQARTRQPVQVRTTRNEGYFVTGLRQPAAKIPSNRTRADDGYAQRVSLVLARFTPVIRPGT